MRYNHLLILLINSITAIGQYSHPFDYCTRVRDASGNPIFSVKLKAEVSVWDLDSAVYRESHLSVTDTAGNFCFALGKGEPAKGKFDSLIWSVGSYFLVAEYRESPGGKLVFRERHKMREPENLNADHDQGTYEFKEPFGVFTFPHGRRKRPKRVQVDITTSYVNTAYPADTYPMYLHQEWIDEDRDGVGSSFSVSYSQNSRNSFATSTRRLGKISLYSSSFQEITVSPDPDRILVDISRPRPIVIYGQTYEIKGPFTLIYYFEW